MMKYFFLLFSCFLFVSSSIADSMSDIYTKGYFLRLQTFLEMNQSIYGNDEFTKAKYADATIFKTKRYHVKYMTLSDPDSDAQVICIRGTHNMVNAWIDTHYFLKEDPYLKTLVHRGFNKAAREMLPQVLSDLEKDRKVILTGHSMGGAIAILLGMYLDTMGYEVHQIITQGQPRVTNSAGVTKFKHLPLLRIANQGDLVVYLPPPYITRYRHFGHKLYLAKDGAFEYSVPGKNNLLDNYPSREGEDIRELWDKIRSSPQITEKFSQLYDEQPIQIDPLLFFKVHNINVYLKRVQEIIQTFPFPQK